MCGILGHISTTPITPTELERLKLGFSYIENRGPDEEATCAPDNLFLGFHRLSINGQDMADGQPLLYDDCIIICNGEIYNSAELVKKYNLNVYTKSDCECIPALYRKFGFKIAMQLLEGVFALALYDVRNSVLFLARDPVGIRPLFINVAEFSVTFASEAKAILDGTVSQFCPGTYSIISTHKSEINMINMRYIDLFNDIAFDHTYEQACSRINELLTHAVATRCANSDRPVGAFLSGGIDSSIIAMLAKKCLPDLRTFSIGLQDSKDLVYARIASEAINSIHTEVVYTIEEGLAVIPELCRILETSDITTIRASIPMYLLSKYIKENTDIIVLLSGEGADEVFSGYLYNHFAPSSFDLRMDAEIRIVQLPWYDVLRADRTTAANGLEIRVPFLCKNVVRYAFSINSDFHNPRINKIEKKILRDIYDIIIDNNERNCKWQTIISRPKEAFSDGVGYSWKKSISDLAEGIITDEELANQKWCCPEPKTKEALLYRKYYESYYPGTHYVPMYWMPSWADHGNDPSATVLSIHKELID